MLPEIHEHSDENKTNQLVEAEKTTAHLLRADVFEPQRDQISAHAKSQETNLTHVELTSAILGLNAGPVPPLALRALHHKS